MDSKAPELQYVFLVALQELDASPTYQSVVEAISNWLECPEASTIKDALKSKTTLLILDGYDENPCSDLLKSFRKNGRLHQCKVIVTTRKSHIDDLYEHQDLWLRIHGFSADDARQFFTKQGRTFPTKKNWPSCAQIPLYATIMCGLEDDELQCLESAEFVQGALIDRSLRQLRMITERKCDISIDPAEFDRLLNVAARIAYWKVLVQLRSKIARINASADSTLGDRRASAARRRLEGRRAAVAHGNLFKVDTTRLPQ